MLLLTACAGLPSGTGVIRRPPTLAEFEFDGRIVVRQDETRHYANIAWRHGKAGDEVLLSTPLGQGVAELRRDATGARLVMADRHEYVAVDWEELSEMLFGWRLPLNDMPAWLAGHAPAAISGWRVEYLDYQSVAVDALPILIEARRGNVEVRLKINEWSQAR